MVAPWQWLADSVGLVLLAVVCYGFALIVRRRWLSRAGGTFELSNRVRAERPGRGWVLGLGRYEGEELQWFRIFTLGTRPKRSWQRGHIAFREQREPQRGEQFSLYGGHVIVVCETDDGPVELAMSPSALTGFQAWLESAPPGLGVNRA